MKHAIAADDISLACRLIEAYGLGLLRRGETTSLLAWLDTMPERAVRQSPRLALLHAQALLVKGRLDAAEALIQVVEQSTGSEAAFDGLSPDIGPLDRLRLRGEVLAARATIEASHDNYQAAIAANQQALKLIPQTDTMMRATIASELGAIMAISGRLGEAAEAFRTVYVAHQTTGDLVGMLESLWQLGIVLFARGELSATARALREAIALGSDESGRALPAASAAYCYLSRVFYEWNRCAEALPLVEESLWLNARNGDAGLEVRALLLMGKLRCAMADYEGVRECIRRVEQIQHAPGIRQRVTQLAATVSARLALFLDDIATTNAWAREAGLNVEGALGDDNEFASLTFVRLLLATGRIEEASHLLARMEADAALGERVDMIIEVGMLQALVARTRGNRDSALALLHTALVQAQPGGYVRLFIDEGAPMVALLAHLRREGRRRADMPGISSTYVATLLAAARNASNSGEESRRTSEWQANLHMLDVLSQREVEIVRCIAAGMSNAEIARDLAVESSTVKWHVHNILEKLGCTAVLACWSACRLWGCFRGIEEA